MVWAERFVPDPNDAVAVAYRLWKDQRNQQNWHRRQMKGKQQEAGLLSAAPKRLPRVVPPRFVEAAASFATELEAEPTPELPSPRTFDSWKNKLQNVYLLLP